MIEFICPGCGKRFSVPDNLAGRKAACKQCKATLIVPAPLAAAPPPGAPGRPKLSMRTRRLMADAQQMRDTFHEFPLIRIEEMVGEPPEVYRIAYTVESLDKGPGAQPVPRDDHRVEIQLTADYPRLAPKCRMLTSIFHPNIDPATICVGDHWAAGERLVDLVIRIGEMIAFQAYNIKSPLDAHAAMWTDLNASRLPTDSRSMRPADRIKAQA